MLEGAILKPSASSDVRADGNTSLPKGRQKNRAGRHQRGSQAAGKMPTAAWIGKAPIFDKAGIIRVTGAGRVGQAFIVVAFHIPIWDQNAKRCSGAPPLPNAAHDAKRVWLYAGSG